jgi:hypothetical protein
VSEPTNKTYRIRTVSDLLDVPADRLQLCLLETGVAVLHAQAMRDKYAEQLKKLPRVLRWVLPSPRNVLIAVRWIDDGKFTAHINGRKVSDDWTTDAARAKGGAS